MLPVTTSTTLPDALLRGAPGNTALIADDDEITYAELRERITARAAQIGLDRRSVVVLHGPTSLEFVVSYLALFEAGHVPLLTAQHAHRITAAWRAAAIVTVDGHSVSIDRTGEPQPDLHPDLAMLLSTSGSTGNPKLVRLSHRNVASNAAAIAEYLALTPADRSITALPLHYCYGLSVLHSHLRAGAGVVLTQASVVDPCFGRALERHAVTNVAGVPHTFELAERAGADRLHGPSLRLLTVAGGRLHPDAVIRWADRAEAWGAELVVMYGQTEATARMAYLPPALVRDHPSSIGVPIPGGELRVDAPSPELGTVGELVYSGANVMLGYATQHADLALGATIRELRTGDLGRVDPATGLFEITGRRSRLVKPFGLRIDLDGLERELAVESLGSEGATVAVAGDDHRVTVHAPSADAAAVARWAIDRTGLPEALVDVVTEGPIPRTASGKVDHATMLLRSYERTAMATTRRPPDRSVAAVFATVLGRSEIGGDDTFVSLGGDSLGYVEASIRLEAVIGRLPEAWHLLPVSQLDGLVDRPRPQRGVARHTASLDSTVVLRAIAICAVVATHMRVSYYPGGAHLLLAVCGYNLSRFLLPIATTRERVRAGLRTVGRVALPTVVWITAGIVAFGAYGPATLLLVNNYAGPETHRGDHWHFWFIEVFAHLVVLTTLLLSVPAVRRLERRRPYEFALGVLAATLVFRYGVVEIGAHTNLRFRTHGVAWFFALGWVVQRSEHRIQRAITTVVCVAVIPGFFGFPQREWFIATCLVALVWWRQVPVPRLAVGPIALVSAASMWILITHFTVWPALTSLVGRHAAYPATIATGVLAWLAFRAASAAVTRQRNRRPRRLVAPTGSQHQESLVRIP